MTRLPYADVGLVVLGLTTPSAVMSQFLPSPSTGYDKASGQISSGPRSIGLLRRGEVLGAVVSVAIAAGAALVASQAMGPHAAWIFVGAIAILGLFLWEYERAISLGQADHEAAKAAP